jgi:hypothetical protein
MLPSEVNNVKTRDSVEFDKQGNIVRYIEYIFFVGDHGPYLEKFYIGEQDTPSIERRINNRVAQLRELGLLTQGAPATES